MILFLKHALTEGPGLLGDFFAQTSWCRHTVELWDKQPLPELSECEAIVTLGGPMNVYETKKLSFLAAEEVFLRDAVTQRIPVLGICLGAQLLAKISGANVMRAPEQEIGWYNVSRTEQGRADALLEGLPDSFEVFQWHADTFTIPPDASLIVTADVCKHQAFRVGHTAWGLQFHPEMTQPMLAEWLTRCPDGYDAQLIMSDYLRKKDSYQRCAQVLFSNFARSIMHRTAVNN
ncbi:MAG: type 1 glutamine amidotransferase [Candidatus Omnitrophota bacterium]|nr:type 1 glutamine amidotransferase [Candidatus Omnitrophota bacterium]